VIHKKGYNLDGISYSFIHQIITTETSKESMSESQGNHESNSLDPEMGTQKKSDLSSLLSASSFMFFCRVFGAAIAFLTQLLLARWMGAHELGIYVYAFSWCIILSAIVGLGYEAATFRVIGQALSNKRFDLIKGYILRGQQMLLLMGLITVLIFSSILNFSDGIFDPEYKDTLMLALITIPVYLIAVFHESVSHAFSWFAMMIMPNNLIRPSILLLALTITWFTTGSLSSEKVMLYQLLAIMAVVFVHFLIFRKKVKAVVGNTPASFETLSWIRIGLPQLIPVLFIAFLAEINVIMVGFYLPPEEVAIFSISFRVAMLITFMIFAVDSIFRPKAALLFADGNMQDLQKLTAHSTQLMFWPGLLCVIIFILLGKFILGVFGEEFVVGYEVFALLAVSQLFTVSIGPVATLLNVTGHQDYSLMVFSTALIVLIILDVILTPIFGMKGAAIAVIIVTAFWNFWLLALVKKHLKIHPTVLSFAHSYK